MTALAAHGIRTVINNRPDGEGGPDQPTSDAIAAAAHAAGMDYHYIPVISGQVTQAQVDTMASTVAAAKTPVLAFCRSGARSSNLWAMGLQA
jgi:sulfide:quinone oxidoreductase